MKNLYSKDTEWNDKARSGGECSIEHYRRVLQALPIINII